MNKRVVTYARVSSDDRNNDGRNLDGQLEMCREYALKRGYQIVEELAEDDRGASGATFELEQLNRVQELARLHRFDVLVTREIDRLSRNLAKQLIVEEELKRSGVSIEYVLGEYPDTPEGNLNKHIRATIAEYERAKIRERMLRGRELKAKAGKWVGHCKPFGYAKDGKGENARLVIDENQASIIRQIFHLFIKEKASLRQIASRLTAAHIPIPGIAYNKPGSVWLACTIRRILANTSYIGIFKYRGIEINLPDMAIISEDTFNQAQEILSDNRKWQRKYGRYAIPNRYLLLDHFFCSCGYRMTTGVMGRKGGKKYIYYHCITTSYPKEKNPCKPNNVRVQVVDDIAWEWLKALMSMDEARLRKGLYQITTQRESLLEGKRARLAAIDSQIIAAEKKINGLMHLFSGDENKEVQAALRNQVDGQTRLIEELNSHRERISQELSQGALEAEQIESILDFADQIRNKMDNASHEQRRKLVELLNVRVVLVRDDEGKRLDMECDLPGSHYVKMFHQTKMSPRRNIAHPSWR